MQKLLIADISEEFCAALEEALCDTFDIRLCNEGNRALELMKSFRPDIVFLDMMIPGMDGIGILENAIQANVRPAVLAAVHHVSDYLWNCINKLGVAYAMRKPCSVETVAARLMDMRTESRRICEDPVVTVDPIKSILVSLGIKISRGGYTCLCAAIQIERRDPGQAVTKSLYPAIAAQCGGTWTRVDKAMRDAIKQAWYRRDNAVWQRYFPRCCREEKCPTNGEFISGIATYLINGHTVIELSGSDRSA